MKRVCIDLSDDCWELIFIRLEDSKYDLASVSLACKRFLSITNRVKVSLLVSRLTIGFLPSLLRRFRNLKSLEFRLTCPEDPHGIITQVSQSDLQHLEAIKFHATCYSIDFPIEDLQKLGIKFKGLKRLDLSGLYHLCDKSLVVLKDFFLGLEELVIQDRRILPVTDEGIEALTSKLKALKKIALIGCGSITDKSIMSLSSNCKHLTNVRVNNCKRVTENGIGFLMRHSPQLTSLFLLSEEDFFWLKESEITFENSISYANNLEDLRISCLPISNDVLSAIAKASPPLKCLHLLDCGIKTINGVTMLLKACPSLKDFSTEGDFLTDVDVLEISQHLSGLTHINLSGSSMFGRDSVLGSATFFMLTKNCPLLESIDMGFTNVGNCEDINNRDLHQNYRLKNLDLSGCSSLNDRELVTFGLVCPNLELLSIRHCKKITNIGEFLRVCPKLKQLDISRLDVTNVLGQYMEDNNFNLTSIDASYSRINDEALRVIGQRYPILQKFDLRGCQNTITDHGVNELLNTCDKLKVINLNGCKNVNVDSLRLIMSSKNRSRFFRNGSMLTRR